MEKGLMAMVFAGMLAIATATAALAEGNSEPGLDRYLDNLGRQQATEVEAQCGSGAGSGSFGYFGKDWNLGNEQSGHYLGGSWPGPGANGYQTGLNNSSVCGNRQGNLP